MSARTFQDRSELTVLDVEARQASAAEERAFLHVHITVLALLLLNHLLHSRRSLIHQIPATDASVQPRVDLIHSGHTHTHTHTSHTLHHTHHTPPHTHTHRTRHVTSHNHARTHARTRTGTHTHTRHITRTHTHTHTHTHITHTHTHTHTHHTHTHTHTQITPHMMFY